MPKLIAFALILSICSCVGNIPEESGTLEVVSFSPAEGTKIDCNTTIKFQLKYELTNLQSAGSRTITAQNNQTGNKNYSVNVATGEISDQISGQDFYTTFFSAKCRKGKVPFSFQFSLNLANGKHIDTRTYLFDEVPGTGCLANTGWC